MPDNEEGHFIDRHKLNPLENPPQELKNIFKAWRPHADPAQREECYDLDRYGEKYYFDDHIWDIQRAFVGEPKFPSCEESISLPRGMIYNIPEIEGLLVAPGLLSQKVQIELLSRLLHRDLSNSQHKTNLHLHHEIQYPKDGASFFSQDPTSICFPSKDGNENKHLNIRRALEKKMRWMTLGGQYDWTNKEYPLEKPPKFPQDIARLMGGIFTDMEAQAAIVNLYSPGDTLSMHRDVSEDVNRGLVSISLGCEAIFIVGLYDEIAKRINPVVLRLNSGDAVYMTGKSRFAWHGVPRIISNTCPKFLEDWPGEEFPIWEGWMKNKRINLNVRQMRTESSALKAMALKLES